MFPLWLLPILVLSLTSAPTTQPANPQKITTKVVGVSEKRLKVVDPQEETLDAGGNELVLVVRLGGRPLAGATKYGLPQLEEAVDDTGAKLIIRAEEWRPDDELQRFDTVECGFGRVFRNAWFDRRKPDGGLVEIRLNAPGRNASRIKTLKGVLPVWSQGRKAVLSFPNAVKLLGTKIEDPVLTGAKLEIKVLKPEELQSRHQYPHDFENAVSLELSGNLSALDDVGVVDKEGAELGHDRRSTSYEDKKQIWTLRLSKPLDDTMRLRITAFVEQKIIMVPFDLKDIPLP